MGSAYMSGRLRDSVIALLAVCLCATSALAQEAAATEAATADTAATPIAAVPVADPRIARIDALIAGTLDVTVSPQSLFEIPLTNEAALQVETLRIRTLLAAIDPATDALSTDIETLDPALWRGRVDLDRARLAFYSLDKTVRDALLEKHAKRAEEYLGQGIGLDVSQITFDQVDIESSDENTATLLVNYRYTARDYSLTDTASVGEEHEQIVHVRVNLLKQNSRWLITGESVIK